MNYTGNTHGGMAKINGEWYIFYHRQTNKIRCSRQACAERLTILPDGSIPQVEVTSCGLNGGPLSAKGTHEARIACNLSGRDGIIKSDNARKRDKKDLLPYFTQSGADREGDGDQYIANLRDGAWCGFKYFSFDGTERSIAVTVRGAAHGKLEVSFQKDFQAVAAVVPIDQNEKTETVHASFLSSKGVYPLYFRFLGDGAADFICFVITI